MGLRLIRQSSSAPNVSNTDDARMVRYAYGGVDGAVKSYGTELAPTINGNTLKIGSGCIVLQGWEVVLDANGYDVTVDNIDVLRYYSVYLEVNLATESFAIKTLYDTAGYPDVTAGEDLTAQTTGTARLPLYQFTAKGGVIENVTKKFSVIEYVKEQMQAVQDSVAQSLATYKAQADQELSNHRAELDAEIDSANKIIASHTTRFASTPKRLHYFAGIESASFSTSEITTYGDLIAIVELYVNPGLYAQSVFCMCVIPVHRRSNTPSKATLLDSVTVTVSTSSSSDVITFTTSNGTINSIRIYE